MVAQLSTLLKKNFHQIRHHYCDTVCNLINPIIWLFVIFLAREIAEIVVIQSLPILKTDIPVIYNIPLYAKLKYSNLSAKTTNCEEWYLYDFAENANDGAKEFFARLISSKNMLRSFCNDNPQQFNASPYFRTPMEAKLNDTETTINEYLYNRVVELNQIDIKEINKEKVLQVVPEGTMTINILNSTIFNYSIQVRDYLVSDYHRGSGVTLFYIYNENSKRYEILPSAITGTAWEIGIMNKAFMHELYPNITVNSGIQILPIGPADNELNVKKVVSIVTSGLYPIAISLLIPLFTYNIVNEKEKKIFQYLKISGVKMRYYWISNFISNYIIYIIMALLFAIFESYVFPLRYFGDTSILLILLTFSGWGISQIGLSYFFYAFISKERISTVAILSFYFFISFTFFCINLSLFNFPREAPYILNIFPTYALIRIFHYITYSCGYHSCISEFAQANAEVKWIVFFLFFDGILYAILGILLNAFFVKRNLVNQLFYIDNKDEEFEEKLNKNKLISNIEEEKSDEDNIIDNNNDNIDNDNNIKTNIIEKDNNYEPNHKLMDAPLNDEEVHNEIELVKNLINTAREGLKEYPLICNEISDENNKYLKNFSLTVKKNEIVGILDSNKANKASFYSLLNNIFNLNNNNIYINGNEIKYNMEKINELIGFCPKNNRILWDDLTVEETLRFYSEIKNSKKGKTNIEQMVKTILTKTNLETKKTKMVGTLKEIMKRRLVLGIALIGEPAILFLDEPTKGLNPHDKRKFWNTLKNIKKETSMVILFQTMDEMQHICDRVGIISNGSLKHLGNPYKFITNYSKYYKLEINLNYKERKKTENKEIITTLENEEKILENAEKKKKIKELMYGLFPKGCCVYQEYLYIISFKIRYDVLNVNKLFEKLKEVQEKYQIANWTMSQFSIDDLFIRLINSH